MARDKSFDAAARAHSNLTTFATVVSILESGSLYGGNERTNEAAAKIIRICKSEQQRLLREYDVACARLTPGA